MTLAHKNLDTPDTKRSFEHGDMHASGSHGHDVAREHILSELVPA